jgi:tetratricopeptide (TPR) repeat protein
MFFGSMLFTRPAAVAEQFSDQGTRPFVEQKDWNGLLRYGTAWTQAQPDNAHAWLVVGTARYNLQQYPEAIDADRRATQLDPSLFSAWYELTAAYNAMGTRVGYHELAVAAASHLDTTAKADWEWFQTGNIYTYLGEITPSLYPKAEAAFLRVVKMNPKASGAWYNLGNVEEDLQNYKGAVNAYRRAAQEGEPQATAALNKLQGLVNSCANQKKYLLNLPSGTTVSVARYSNSTYNSNCAWLTGRVDLHFR